MAPSQLTALHVDSALAPIPLAAGARRNVDPVFGWDATLRQVIVKVLDGL
jgi:hypothetical protein